MAKLLFAAAVLVALTVIISARYRAAASPDGVAAVTLPDGTIVQADIMDTPAARAQGLSGRDGLPEGEGMLFLYDTPGNYGFWMKGMKFSIDMVWILGNRVVTVKDHVPYAFFRRFDVQSPTGPADKVLELPAGYAAAHGVREGVTLDIQASLR